MPEARPGFRRGNNRRKLGVTFTAIVKSVKGLKEAGEIDDSMTFEEVAAAVLNDIVDSNPKAFADPSIDWDALLAFIERILPLILMIFGL